jgi:hypothetical protein
MATATDKTPASKNPRVAAATRVNDLLARMSLAEKVARMMGVWQEKTRKRVDGGCDFEQSCL